MGVGGGLHISVCVTAGQFAQPGIHFSFMIPNAEFFKIAEDRPTAARRIVSEVLSRLRSSPKAALTIWFFAKAFFEKHWVYILPRMRCLSPPFAKFLADVRTDHTDLTYNNLGAINEDERPVRSNALQLANKTLEAIFVSDVYPAWTPKDDDPDVYGVGADYSITRYWAVIHVDDYIADLLPEIGDQCSFFSSVGIKKREIPAGTLTANQITKIVRSVVQGCHAGERVAENVDENFRKQTERAQTKCDNEDTVGRLQTERPWLVSLERVSGEASAGLAGDTQDADDDDDDDDLTLSPLERISLLADYASSLTHVATTNFAMRFHRVGKDIAKTYKEKAPQER
ncbi:hypothetical protein CEP54_005782 [Fusarium duplospermum]|uniref:Uncharacterized protein n=1 Tax=Fusarium duplospermum TaxID=1325734 RepID=A0A428QAM8_9HYPO|nr:hypothetical protein CEP54_005782 [Fusarium duplospermum]